MKKVLIIDIGLARWGSTSMREEIEYKDLE
jgi:hypothetical protein